MADQSESRILLVEDSPMLQTRLVELAIADPATVAPPVVTYNCPADSGPLTRLPSQKSSIELMPRMRMGPVSVWRDS